MPIHKKSQKGFTLLELAIVILITGIMFIPLVKMYETYDNKRRIEATRERIAGAASQVMEYKDDMDNGTLYAFPCPADPTLPKGDPNYGREFMDCRAPTSYANFKAALAAEGLVNPGDCTGGASGVCLAAGTNTAATADLDGDGNPDPVLVGMLPITDMIEAAVYSLSESVSYDSWGGRLTYAVSAFLTNDALHKTYGGTIRAQNEFGNHTAGVDNNAMYVVVSHGENRSGAYHHESGALINPCGAVFPDPNGAVDHENCDLDAVFTSAIGYYKGNTNRYYDDFIKFEVPVYSEIWRTTNGAEYHLWSASKGKFGIGTNAPSTRIDVNGTTRATNNIRAKEICDKVTGKCFEIDAYAGTGDKIACSSTNGAIMTGIKNTGSGPEEDCALPMDFYVGNLKARNCRTTDHPNAWVNGITSDGEIICTSD